MAKGLHFTGSKLAERTNRDPFFTFGRHYFSLESENLLLYLCCITWFWWFLLVIFVGNGPYISRIRPDNRCVGTSREFNFRNGAFLLEQRRLVGKWRCLSARIQTTDRSTYCRMFTAEEIVQEQLFHEERITFIFRLYGVSSKHCKW